MENFLSQKLISKLVNPIPKILKGAELIIDNQCWSQDVNNAGGSKLATIVSNELHAKYYNTKHGPLHKYLEDKEVFNSIKRLQFVIVVTKCHSCCAC